MLILEVVADGPLDVCGDIVLSWSAEFPLSSDLSRESDDDRAHSREDWVPGPTGGEEEENEDSRSSRTMFSSEKTNKPIKAKNTVS